MGQSGARKGNRGWTVTIDTGAGKAETYDETCQNGDKHSATLDPDNSVCPAPDSPNNLEAGVKIPKINGGEIRAAEPSFLENRLFIYPDKASDTTTTTTDEKVCVMRLVSMLLLLLLNYWLWYGGV